MDMFVYATIYAGSGLMVYNIVRYAGFTRRMRDTHGWGDYQPLLNVPLVLLSLFLVGYLIVGLFGEPDIIVASILFGGSVFVDIILRVMLKVIDRLRESNAQAEAQYTEMRESLENLTQDRLTVFRVNLSTDEIEDRGGTHLSEEDLRATTYTQLIACRDKCLLSEPVRVGGYELFSRDGLLECFSRGRTHVEETRFCDLGRGRPDFVKIRASLAVQPESRDIVAFVQESICNDELVNEAILTKALIGQFDMITYLMNGEYEVVIGDYEHAQRGSILPTSRQGTYGRYLGDQVAPVIRGSEDERQEALEALSLASVERALETIEPYEVNIACDIDGDVFYKRFAFYVIDRRARFYLLLKSDTTDARREEIERNERLSEALAEAQRANQSKTLFFSNLSHDLRTPMNAIVGYTEFARRSESREQMGGYLEKIDSSSKYMLALINDVLEMSRIESGKMELVLEDCDIVYLVNEVYDMFETQMRDKEIDFSVDTSRVRDRRVLCDRTRVNRVLLNLLSNAYKFTPRGGTVLVRLDQLDGAPEGMGLYELHVRDTGIGMSPEFAAKVFESFERDRGVVTSGIQGTGLGMAITKRIVDMMGGTITVASEVGKGTEFLVRLPLSLRQEGVALTVEEAERAPIDEDFDFSGMRALLVEDNAINREIAAMLLEGIGFELDEAVNGRDAVDRLLAAEPGTYDVVITDIQMPVMDGYEEARTIRALPNAAIATIPIVAMSANAFKEDIAQAKRVGIDGYVAKPVNVDELMSTLRRTLK
ncbi:MAG: response regulator [Atopobiaceae bacterium]|nr:response regulator [Atopobiaceae bacterium]